MPYDRNEVATMALSALCTRDRTSWRSVCPMLFFFVVEGHNPMRVMRQFGRFQDFPPITYATSSQLHR